MKDDSLGVRRGPGRSEKAFDEHYGAANFFNDRASRILNNSGSLSAGEGRIYGCKNYAAMAELLLPNFSICKLDYREARARLLSGIRLMPDCIDFGCAINLLASVIVRAAV